MHKRTHEVQNYGVSLCSSGMFVADVVLCCVCMCGSGDGVHVSVAGVHVRVAGVRKVWLRSKRSLQFRTNDCSNGVLVIHTSHGACDASSSHPRPKYTTHTHTNTTSTHKNMLNVLTKTLVTSNIPQLHKTSKRATQGGTKNILAS